MTFKLHTENIPGNLHQAATWINKAGWAEFVIAMDTSGHYTVAVFKMPTKMVHNIRRNNRSFALEPEHDDKCWHFDE